MSATKTSARTKRPPDPKRRTSGQRTLGELIDAALARSREADPHVIAKRLLPKLPLAMREELAYAGLLDRVTLYERQRREDGGIGQSRRAGPSKWSVGLRVCPAGEWKLLENCDLADLHALAEQHRDIAAKNLARAQEYDELADELRASGCATVGEMRASAEDLAA